MTRRSGIYGLFRLDKGPLDPRHAALLGLPEPHHASACAIGVDDHIASALHRAEDDDALTVLVGHIDEVAELSARLGLPPGSPDARVARAALARFGADTPVHMIGEWSLLHYQAGALALMQSAGLRDRIFYTIHGSVVAIAPDLVMLSKLPWVSRDIDEEGLLFALGRAPLRARNDGRTMLAAVHRLEAGGSVRIGSGGVRVFSADALTPQSRWQGSFHDAVAECRSLLRTIVAERMRRAGSCVTMLSGGLDSSTLAWLTAEQRPADVPLWFITSVAPPDCDRGDERHFADLVANHLGVPTNHLFPDKSVSLYRPSDALMEGVNGPPMGTRQGMSEPFQQFAASRGATLMFNGIYGEMTVTAKQPLPTWRSRLRRAFLTPRRNQPRPTVWGGDTGAFNIRLARHRLSHLPDSVADAMAAPPRNDHHPGPDGLCGYRPGAAKALHSWSEPYRGAVREDFTFRDLRLLRLFARFPAPFMTFGGLNRALSRHMLHNHIPDAIRLRMGGLPASPDHLDRLQWQAPAARARIALFRKAGVDDWIDLEWLDGALERAAANGLANYADANDVQLTAVTAEYLMWWRNRP